MWNPIETAPKDRPVLAWCDHEADPHSLDGGKHIFEPLPARTYRLLNRGDRIEPGDQVLLDDASTWAPLDLHGIDRIAGNSNYDPGFHMPMRRPT